MNLIHNCIQERTKMKEFGEGGERGGGFKGLEIGLDYRVSRNGYNVTEDT